MTAPRSKQSGTGESVSTGKLMAGRWLGIGGLLGPRARITRLPTHQATPVATIGPTVLMAVAGDAISESVVRTAHHLFGETATFLAINVGPGPYSQLSWAYVWPVGSAAMWIDPAAPFDDSGDTAADTAKRRAETITQEAGLAQATPIGDVGDATSAIMRAAHHHHADVVVIGADQRGWLSHLIDRSVERELLREADFAVLVAAEMPTTESSSLRRPS